MKAPTKDQARETLVRLLRGDAESAAGPIPWDQLDLLDRAMDQRVHLLLAWKLKELGVFEKCPSQVREMLERAIREASLVERVRGLELQENLERLARAGVQPILLKGVSLAYRCYPHPYLRPHLDIDVFIREDQQGPVRQAMERAGYRRSQGIEGDLIQRQFYYEKSKPQAIVHAYDFHWRVSNPELFANLISFESAEKSAVEIPALGVGARGLGDAHALALACVHRVAHHRDEANLLWLYDIHLLSERLPETGWQDFEELTAASRTRTICKAGIDLAITAFGTKVPSAVMKNLSAATEEPSAAFLRSDFREIDVQLSNLKHLHGWRARWELIRQNLFPEPRYMRKRYRVSNGAWLPLLYVYRIMSGAPRWFRPARRRTDG